MGYEFKKSRSGSRDKCIPLYAGINLSYTDNSSDFFSLQHEELRHIMQINYCRAGQIVWKMRNGNSIFLNPGDFSVHILDAYMDLSLHFPTGLYQGLTICIDLQETSAHPPELIAETGVFNGLLREKFCQKSTFLVLTGNGHSESIFSSFYDQPEKLKLPYQRVKVLELLLYLAQIEVTPQKQPTGYLPEQIELVKTIHDQFLQHMEQRITIDELSKQYLINPTTLKTVFKSVYGTSLAAHIKQHRMEQAAKMLRESNMSIAEIAAAVGYESQSKFTAAFKNQFTVSPRAYRKPH